MTSVFEEPIDESTEEKAAKPTSSEPKPSKPKLRPRARVVKAGGRQGVGDRIVIQGRDGRESYKVPCVDCGDMTPVKQLPGETKEILCNVCYKIRKHGKPSTEKVSKGTRYDYRTQCDKCGKYQETPFLPKADRSFLCDRCHRQEPQRYSGPLKRGVEVLGTKKDPLFLVPCDSCRKKVKVKFAPRAREPFHCQDCFSQRPKKRRGRDEDAKPTTKVMFQIECAECGRHEVVNFIPSSLSAPICSRCYAKKHKK
ncbi:hypothetical protein SCOR_16960 [Sulfidibacter corallicola]|uniref:Uncharacterized protein n=1 Tax=Sulfidibacter corallicola TaxID=2818388 RepID=A0A8A4TV70_SULCO|nr:hypothetical protein [Sulfidibacter corallicola]QTD53849.1 hypothetical protein J3U87_15480 [Sulfidibacter corallicola]